MTFATTVLYCTSHIGIKVESRQHQGMSMLSIKNRGVNIFVVLAMVGIFAEPLHGNDTSATIAAGGIVFKTSDDISMDEEVLKLSIERIDVAYRFFNHANHQIQETIAFPLPPIPYGEASFRDDIYPTWDEEYFARQLLDENRGGKTTSHTSNSSNLYQKLSYASFINFERTVNGEVYGYEYRNQAFLPNNKDITEFLRRHDIPLSIQYLRGFMNAGKLNTDRALKNKIQKLGLLDKKGEPRWRTQTTYFWTQYFEPKQETLVTHTYRPRPGYHWLEAKSPKTLGDVKFQFRGVPSPSFKDYCVSPEMEGSLLHFLQSREASRVIEMQYILKTGANWKGPIKKFRLEITPPKGTAHTLFCWKGPLQTGADGKIVSEINDFKPDQDLRILFVMNYSAH